MFCSYHSQEGRHTQIIEDLEQSRVAVSEDNKLNRKVLKQNFRMIIKEEISQSQKDRIKRLKQRDSNTKFFHRFAYGRRTRNYIYFLDFKGRLSDDRAVKNEIIHFYRSFYLKVKTREATFLLWQGKSLPAGKNFMAEEAFSFGRNRRGCFLTSN